MVLLYVTLLISSLHYKNVWYVFPLFINTNELALSSPNFLDRAYFVKINNFPSCTFDGNPNKVEIDPRKQSVSIFSNDKVGLKAYNGKEFLIKMKEETIPITIEEIKMKKLTWEYVYPKLEELGVKKITLDRIREKDKKLHHRFTSGFF
ncbi:MAG: hypothetical protein QXI49_06805 [Candidatus Methanomethylicaceae archaeon]